MNQKQIDKIAEALRSQGLTWAQTNFAVSLVRNNVEAERERWTEAVMAELDGNGQARAIVAYATEA